MNIGVIILCRYSSSRLPGKILRTIDGKPVLKYIIERVSVVLPGNAIVVATSDESSDDSIEEYCRSEEINCFRGSLNRVADRFLECAKNFGFDFAIRINGDNIFVDTALLKEVINVASTYRFSFISNVDKRTFPKGMSIEGISIRLFREKIDSFSESEQEHVMIYFYKHLHAISHYFIYNTICPEVEGIQLAIDTSEDFELIRMIISKFRGPHLLYNLKEISVIIKELNNNNII